MCRYVVPAARGSAIGARMALVGYIPWSPDARAASTAASSKLCLLNVSELSASIRCQCTCHMPLRSHVRDGRMQQEHGGGGEGWATCFFFPALWMHRDTRGGPAGACSERRESRRVQPSVAAESVSEGRSTSCCGTPSGTLPHHNPSIGRLWGGWKWGRSRYGTV